MLIDDSPGAVGRLRALERYGALKNTSLYALWRAAMRFSIAPGDGEDADFDASLDQLRDGALGGFALLLATLATARRDVSHRLAALTPTERRVLQRLLIEGRRAKSIAMELNRSPETIDTHVKAILRKLQCKGRMDAARIAREHGLC